MPDAEGYVGRQYAPYVRTQGRLGTVVASGIKAWNGDPASDPALTECGLSTGAPALFGRWRVPALERRVCVRAYFRVLDCLTGEVGLGIVERRMEETFVDGYDADRAATELDRRDGGVRRLRPDSGKD